MQIELRQQTKVKAHGNPLDANSKVRTYWWVILSANGNVLLTSETYTTSSSRTRVAKKFSKNTGIPIAAPVAK